MKSRSLRHALAGAVVLLCNLAASRAATITVNSGADAGDGGEIGAFEAQALTPTPTATPCGTMFLENFDGVTPPALPSGWTTTIVTGPPPAWATSATSPDSAPNDAFITDTAVTSDKVLDTPDIVITSTTPQLSFRNNFDMEFSDATCWDGGVLEVSSPNINGGAFTDVTNALVGGSFVTGEYTGTINDVSTTNPLAARDAWCGSSGGYINTVINLGPNLNGQTIKLRFRMGTDVSVGAPGWRIDTISIVGGACPSPTPTPTPTPTATATSTAAPTATSTATATPTATSTSTPTPNPTATPPITPTTLANISTRLRVETGDNALIGGFIVTGTQPKKVIIRGIGPSLGLTDQLANPTLELYSGQTLLKANDDWMNSSPADKQAIIDSTIPPSNDAESAIVATLPANGAGYTAVLRGVNNGTGIGVIQIYDLDRSVDSKLANISTRGFVQTGDNVLFAGTIVLGQAPQKVIIRALGPSVPAPGAMADPTLELRDGNGALLDLNDNWVDSPNKQAIIDSTIPPTNDAEAAIVYDLPANGANYTAIVRGAGGTTGIAVVEVYALN